MYSFTNQFSGPTLHQRVGMINSRRSGPWAWWRYALWVVLMGCIVLACQHEVREHVYIPGETRKSKTLAATSPTRARVVELEDKKTWYRHLALFENKIGTAVVRSKPIILCLKADHFVLPDDYKYESAIYIDGEEASVEDLEKLSPEFVSELFVMHQWENMPDADKQAKPYQILIQTSSRPVIFNERRKQFFTLLQAAALSKHPLGETFSFNMNQLLEATFFHDKNALVERTKNEHLRIYDECTGTTEVFINNLPATPADVKTVHVREVARLYTKERPYDEWFRADYPSPRFELHIETTPKRAKRDTSHYVFSPFYTGDF
ncbi:hypothetical protein [Spirosoma sp.]|uniref:hypothetical protein n=1 Tax=Spirosoma sp. TaxID=1899569 RepID=UPI002638FE6D|nr:hypothetical protein [Spirosoma sp.]MCX6214814.1 hypothetical protein [Spirosoma sp.]